VSFIKNLERFCNEVAANKLFWTPEVVHFFGITDATLKREFEFAREDLQRRRQARKEGLLTNYRRQSYVNLERGFVDNEITEDCSSGDSGSTKNSKQVHPMNFVEADPQNPSANPLGQ